ncbi:MAG: hypothetical protein WBB37_07440 [bacterium]
MKIPQEILRGISERPSGERRSEVKKTALLYNVDISTVYRALQKYENRIKELRLAKDEEKIVLAIMGLKVKSRGKKHQRISTQMAIKEAVRRKLIPDNKYSRARIDEVARILGLDERHMRMPKPCVRLTTPGPNTWAQTDFSVAQCFYLKNMRVHFRNIYSKKEPKRKVILGSYVEMYSGCKFWYAYEALGENTRDATDFLYRAFIKKNATFPLHGLPWNIYCDQGSPFKSGYFKNLLKRLGIDLHLHLPGNARATGMVEKSFQQVQRFEAMLKIRMHPRDWPSIEDFNRWLFEFAVDENNKKIGRSAKGIENKTRFAKWCEIHPDDLRQCPPKEIFMNLTAVGEKRRLVHPEGCIYYGGKAYRVNIPDLCNEKVVVFINVDGKVWIQHPFVGYHGPLEEGVKANVMGVDFDRPELTFWEKNKREAEEIIEQKNIVSPGQYYSREKEYVYKTPEVRRKEDTIQDSFNLLDAKIKISENIGVPLGRMPESTRKIIDEILDSHAEDGMVTNEIIKEICERIKEVMCLE